ncbi:MAG TPA: choice-of-anchor tandem repeat NxxGxxAF-containing protein [Chthoniobacterales bacterium]|nr:choice-of-anchor tandem repeat NxxGxxAF-containing protein [Chthoniobacterales bacterium]
MNYLYPANFKAPDGGDMDLISHYVTPSGSLGLVSHVGSALRRGIFFLNGTTVRKIAYTQEAAPGGGVFSSLGDPSANDAGQVAFAASTRGGPGSGIFLGDSTGLHAIALYTGTAPGGAGTFTSFSSGVIMTTGGKVAFYASTSGGDGGGVYLGTTSGVSLIPLTNQATSVLFNDSDQALFQVHGDVYIGTAASSHVIAAVGDAAPGGGTFSTIQNAVLNNAGQVAFSAYVKRNTTVEGIFLWTPSGIRLIAQSGLAPGGGTFQSASLFNARPVLSNKGQVAFTANTSSGTRLFLGNGADLIKLVGTGDTVSGLIVQNVVLPPPEDGGSGHSAFNDHDQLAYDLVFYQGGYFDELYVFTLDSAMSGSLGNISTRLPVGTGDNSLIAGFIITGSQTKKVIVRGIGPSLVKFGLSGVLTDPVLELHDSSHVISTNDDWQSNGNQQEIIDRNVAPSDPKEAAILTTLSPGSYTAILRGAHNGTGVGTVEVYDLDQTVDSKLANISTRGLVDSGDNVMIGGTIITGAASAHVLIRAIGPSLIGAGVANALQDPALELHDSQGAIIAMNDNWVDSPDAAAISATTLEPRDNRESAILRRLSPGAYTAIVRGSGDKTGVAVVEAYQLP